MSNVAAIGYVCLYDHSWQALGKWSQHLAKSWSINRKAFELDEFQVECQGFENSKNACFAVLHGPTGQVKYASFCGIPVTKNGLTQITGIDCRSIFNQEVLVDYNKRKSNGNYYVDSVSSLFEYLMSQVLIDRSIKSTLGIDYTLDLDDLSFMSEDWDEDYIVRTAEVRNIWKELMAACHCYNVVITTSVQIDSESNVYKLKFKVAREIYERRLKLSDYDVVMRLNQNIVNRAIYCTEDTPTTQYYLYLYNDNTIGTSYNANKALFPPVVQTFMEETIEEARAAAYEALNDSKYKDRVTIDLNSKLGSTLKDMDFTYYGILVGYNPADESSDKKLPVCGLYEDHEGTKKIQFGKLSEYWFMD